MFRTSNCRTSSSSCCTSCYPLEKQYRMMKAILRFFELSKDALADGVSIDRIMSNGWADKLIKIKYDIPNDKLGMFDDYERDMNEWYKNAEVV